MAFVYRVRYFVARMEEKSQAVKVLVLGELGAARRISAQLSEAGFDPVLQKTLSSLKSQGLPHRVHSESMTVLRQALEEFSQMKGSPLWIHPGVSLWAERPELHIAAQAFNLRVMGPTPRIQYLFQNNLQFLLCAQDLGIPHIALSFDPMHTTREIEEFIQQHQQGFPFVLKAVRGNGRFAVRVIQDLQDLRQNLPLWFDQLRWVLGEVMVFPEKYIEGARQILVPFVRFKDGKKQVFEQVDISLQSHNRRAIEFCPPLSLDPEMKIKLQEWTQLFVEKVDYVGVGALEFLVDGPRAFLVRGLPRLHSGFQLWEKMSGIQAVHLQLKTALQPYPDPSKSPIMPEDQSPFVRFGAMLHILAEDPLLALPRPGVIEEVSFQPEFEWNFDHHGTQTRTPSSGYLASIDAEASEPELLFQELEKKLDQLWIAGSLETNEAFLKEVLTHPWMREGIFHAGFLDEEFIYHRQVPTDLLILGVSEIMGHPSMIQSSFQKCRWLAHDRVVPEVKVKEIEEIILTRDVQYAVNEKGYPLIKGHLLFKDQRGFRICAYPVTQDRWNVRIGSYFFRVKKIEPLAPDQPKRAPCCYALGPGRVHALRFLSDTLIPAHEPMVIIESEGVFIPHSIPRDSRVKQWKIEVNQHVELGEELATLEMIQPAIES